MSLSTAQITKGQAKNYIPDPLDPGHPGNPNTPMDPDDPKNPGHPDNSNNPNNPEKPGRPTDEIREPEPSQPTYKFDASNRDPRFYEELMNLMDFGQNELYTRY